MSLIRPSGGLKYHLRAAKSQRLWQKPRAEIAAWLEGWKVPAERELLIFGASGGHMLAPRWLRRFRAIRAYDLDPLAPFIFSLRHRKIPFEARTLSFVDGRLSLEPLSQILAEHPNASLLFSNILGQIPLEGQVNEGEWAQFLSALRFKLQARDWASIHDSWTFEPLPLYAHAAVFKNFEKTRDARRVFADAPAAKTEAIDHLTDGAWVMNLETQLFAWSLNKNSLHILAGVRSKAGA